MSSSLKRQPCCGFSKRKPLLKNCEPAGCWITLALVFLMNILTIIPMNGFGIFYNHLVDQFETSRALVGVTYQTFININGFIALLASPYINRYGTKKVCLVGAFIQLVGYVSCSFTRGIWSYFVTFSIIGGTGHAIVEVASIVVIQQLFDHNRGLATGIACAGYNIGDIVTPFILDSLLQRYGLSGMFLIHAAIQAHAIPIALMYMNQPSKKSENSVTHRGGTKWNLPSKENVLSPMEVFTYSSSLPNLSGDGEHCTFKNTPIVQKMNGTDSRQCAHVSCIEEGSQYTNSLPVLKINDDDVKPYRGRSTSFNGQIKTNAIKSIDKSENTQDMDEEYLCLRGNEEIQQSDKDLTPSMKDTLRSIVDFRILRNKSLSLLFAVRLLWLIIKYGLMSNAVSGAMDKGMDETTAAGVVSVYGITCLCSVLLCMVLLNRKSLNKVLFYSIGVTFGPIAGIMALLGSIYLASFMYGAMGLLGSGEGITYTTMLFVMIDFTGLENLPKGLALTNLIALPALLAAAPFTGWLVDETGAYVAPFLFVTISGVIATCLAVVLTIFSKKWLNK